MTQNPTTTTTLTAIAATSLETLDSSPRRTSAPMATPSSPSSSKPLFTAKPASFSSKKPQPCPWSYPETLHLIQSYQEKWYSLGRGQLKSSQWEEVSVTVAARCGYDVSETSRTATQCRHKMEKLRQRYRSEKQHLAIDGSSRWPYFDLMERLESGPLPISARPMTLIHNDDNEERDRVSEEVVQIDEDYDDEEDEANKSQSISYILQRPTIVNRFSGERNSADHSKLDSAVSGSWKKQRQKAEEGEEGREREMSFGLASEIKAVAGRLMGMENMKLEMMRETERCRMEMEKRRNAMIFRSQQKIVDSIASAFGSPKRMKIDP